MVDTSEEAVKTIQNRVTNAARFLIKTGANYSWVVALNKSAKAILDDTGWEWQVFEFITSDFENAIFTLTCYNPD